MPNENSEQLLEGTTLSVYMYVAKRKRPQGPRDVMRGRNLSSPSVAYRHLQKLETAGLLKRNSYGEYLLNQKAKVNGFHWVGRSLVPRTMFYFYFFLGLLILEAVVLAIHWEWENDVIKTYYAIGMSITGIAMAFFLLEAVTMLRKLKVKDTA